ncbi:hypothetical protein [Leptolyngbya sp. FACHB-261]|uniref:hypothetical protein n=1 Tax=Leptolyngbya sp. FACHB-261 TaxID=2692806 RepID=UPI0016895623|nr:hypothetical protein [Leptolyngbya sp. FACHB-261]MBD2104288.1 hypothetical protein [Leptolyngbya sp. FACHB-261]
MSEVPEKAVGQYQISLRDAEGHLLPAAVELGCRDWTEVTGRRTKCRIKLQWAGGVIEETACHFFESFKRVQEKLALHGLLPMCYRASRRIILTGMAADMALGRKAYRVSEDGQLLRPTVDIFKTGDDVEPVSVEAQEQFQAEWWQLFREQ